jgi:hypothetical protein
MTRIFRETIGITCLLWMRPDIPREQAMQYWRGPHSELVRASPGFLDYRQHHFPADGPGLWPEIDGVETAIPDARRVDGVPEVHVVEMPMESEAGYAHQMRIHADEHNVFGRTLLHSTEPGDGRMWATATRGEVGARTFVLIRKRNDVADSDFRATINDRIGPALATVPGLTELRTQVFVPWSVESWDTPDVAHDYPEDTRYHASMVLGSPDEAALLAALQSSQVSAIADDIRSVASAVHAYPVAATYTYVQDGQQL